MPGRSCVILFWLAVVLGASASPSAAAERTFVAAVDDITLTGDVILPEGEGPHPAIIFTQGSGRGERHRYRRIAAPYLAAGFAAILYDKRGIGDSTGTYVEAPDLERSAGDLLACLSVALRDPAIDRRRVGVWGISQGGWVGPLAASRSSDLSFVIMVSGPTMSPLEQNIFDKGNQLAARGHDAAAVAAAHAMWRAVWGFLATGEEREEARSAWNDAKGATWFDDASSLGPPFGNRDAILRHPAMGVDFVAHSRYDPVPALAALRVPVLAVYGDADTIVPARVCAATLREIFKDKPNADLTLLVYPEADHGIRVTTPDGRRTPAPGYPASAVSWAVARVARDGAAWDSNVDRHVLTALTARWTGTF